MIHTVLFYLSHKDTKAQRRIKNKKWKMLNEVFRSSQFKTVVLNLYSEYGKLRGSGKLPYTNGSPQIPDKAAADYKVEQERIGSFPG
jgi:hypothetical protein